MMKAESSKQMELALDANGKLIQAKKKSTRGFQVPGIKTPSVPEAKFLQAWKAVGGCELRSEVLFHPSRKWKFDFTTIGPAPCGRPVAFEIEGLTPPWEKSRHTTNKGYSEDCLKYSAAAMLGYFVVRLTPDQIQPAYLEEIREAFGL